jgi:lipoyl(octanoyl) transferase
MPSPRVIDLGRISYLDAYQVQLSHHEEVLAARESGAPDPGRILLVEHDPPVITISRRPEARQHLMATPEQLARAGVEVQETDRGGDITYHGPGQLIAYPILDLNHYHLGLHTYMRLLEQSIIDTIATWGIPGERDPKATGVWVRALPPQDESSPGKIAALGVRVRRWVSMHGLAVNVTPNLEHFNLIVPCGLAGRGVTSMQKQLGSRCPPMEEFKRVLAASLTTQLLQASAASRAAAESGGAAAEQPSIR